MKLTLTMIFQTWKKNVLTFNTFLFLHCSSFPTSIHHFLLTNFKPRDLRCRLLDQIQYILKKSENNSRIDLNFWSETIADPSLLWVWWSKLCSMSFNNHSFRYYCFKLITQSSKQLQILASCGVGDQRSAAYPSTIILSGTCFKIDTTIFGASLHVYLEHFDHPSSKFAFIHWRLLV